MIDYLREVKEQYIIYVALGLFVLVTAGLLSLVFSQESANDRLSIQHETVRIASVLLDRYYRQQTFEADLIDPSIVGFGLYGADGAAEVGFGTAPSALEGSGRLAVNPVLQISENRVTLLQPLMMPQMGNAGDGSRVRRQGGMMRSMMEESRSFVFLEVERDAVSAPSRRIDWVVAFVLVLVSFLMAALVFLYNRNRSYRQRAESDRQLMQLGEAARTLAHEIRNPLGSIRIQSKMIEKVLPTDESGHLQIINQEVDRLNLLSTRVSEFIRNPSGNLEPIDMREYVRGLVQRLGFPVRVADDDGAGLSVMFDRDRLPIVCENIIQNAWESMSEIDGVDDRIERVVEVNLKREEGFGVVEVLDRGAGIPKELRDRIFEPFFTTKATGTGLGLATARRLVEAAGGRIVVSDRKGGGTTVRIYFRAGEA